MRRRIYYFIAAVVLIVLGLSVRHFGDRLPRFVADHAGDALWAGMIYVGFRGCLVRQRASIAAGISFLFCMAIEFSQLYQADWIHALRSTVIGGLVLGQGFLGIDLIRYTVGIAIGYGVDSGLLAISGRRRSNNIVHKSDL
ncbi:DUF2809 domain-containing protein [Paenibacillus sp. CF384]|uniref:ribosomal maturation YjgA family protein n=1 Tax=Paenibacillus sp. CF384 TaxID=1884382 RepID=UPI0008984B44|nr:DUF2809 domain-containing protein [Paenibacillus sp. CF384]SDW24641.1 Protein of unknown function [Paenibacillus sp. CF384]